MAPAEVRARLYPKTASARIFVTHTRPEALLGVLQPLSTGAATVGLGFSNHGGTLDTAGMLFVNRATWAHVVETVARLHEIDRGTLLTGAEQAALEGRASPQGLMV
jgi:hypothetical protein